MFVLYFLFISFHVKLCNTFQAYYEAQELIIDWFLFLLAAN